MEEYLDKVKAVVFGVAIGDAVGLLTEMKKKQELSEIYKDVNPFRFPPKESVRGFNIGDWTDETDQLVIAIETLKESINNDRLTDYSKRQFNDPVVGELRLKTDTTHRVSNASKKLSPEVLFADKLKFWVIEGFPSLGDDIGKGCEGMTHQIATRHGYVKNPVGIARNIWSRRSRPATNGCIPRSSIIGLLDDFPTVFKVTERFCLITHPDPRCVAACVVFTYLIYTITHHEVPQEKIEDIVMLAINQGKNLLTNKKHQKQLDKYCYSSLKDLELDEDGNVDHVFKTLGVAIWALRYVARAKRRKNLFTRVIMHIIMEGGDADCNAAAAGALMGAWLGLEELPTKWMQAMPHREWLNDHIQKFVNAKFGEENSESEEPPKNKRPSRDDSEESEDSSSSSSSSKSSSTDSSESEDDSY
jgi:ADP-ribosylglycohydrolase